MDFLFHVSRGLSTVNNNQVFNLDYNAGSISDNLEVSLLYRVSDLHPNPNDDVVFSGYLKTLDDNIGVSGENIILYEIKSDEIKEIKSTLTNDNGYFIISLSIPDERLGSYLLRFPGSNDFNEYETTRIYINSLDKSFIITIAIAVFLVITIVLFFLISRGIPKEKFVKPIVLSVIFGVILQFIGAGFIALIAAGGIAGYLFSKKANSDWKGYLRIGMMSGLLLVLVNDILFSVTFLTSPEFIEPRYTILQGEVFSIIFSQTIFSLVIFIILTGVSAVLGGRFGSSNKNKNR